MLEAVAVDTFQVIPQNGELSKNWLAFNWRYVEDSVQRPKLCRVGEASSLCALGSRIKIERSDRHRH